MPVVTSTTQQITVGGQVWDVTTTVTTTVALHVPDPAPGPVPTPVQPDTVRIGSATYPLSAVNPTAASNPAGAPFPGFRGPDQIIAVRAPAETITTNRYGATVVVGTEGLILAVRDDRPGASPKAAPVTTAVPAGGMVLAGNGQGCGFLISNAKQGGTVQLVHVSPAPGPPPAPEPVPGAAPDRSGNIAVWVMMWPDSPRFDWASIPDEVTEARLAFLINGGQPVGDGPWGLAGLQAGLAGFLKGRPDRFISFAMGGGGYEVDIFSVAGYVTAVKAAEKRWMPGGAQFGGGNVDWESARFRASGDQVASVLRTFKAERPGFFCSWSPNGTFKADYAAVCRRNPDVVDALGFQCYDIPGLSYATVRDDVYPLFVAGGDLKPEQLEVAMMIEPGRNDRWTLDQCTVAASRIKADFGVTRTAFWQAGRPEFPAWARAMRQVNPLSAGAGQ
jgi:hypothetical protein